MIQEAIKRLAESQNLLPHEISGAMEEIMSGQASPAQIGGFLMGLRTKGETPAEIAESARVMRDHAQQIRPQVPHLVDTCGSGGDGQQTFNISTTSALVLAATGVPVAKHGNRAVSSCSGSADVLEALGVQIDIQPEHVVKGIEEMGIGFLFAPSYHLAMRHAANPRRELGIRTIFNLLGPLTNPARAQIQVVGVFRPDLTPILAQALALMGTQRALVVSGLEGLDEISISGASQISQLQGGSIQTFTLDPRDLGLPLAPLGAIRGGTPQENAAITLSVLQGERGPARDITVLNAAAGLVAAGKTSWLEGVGLAAQAIDSGRALRVLQRLITYTQGVSPCC